MQESKSLPDDFEEMDFVVEEENWNEYELDDDSKIKARIILKKIIRDPNNTKIYNFDINPAIFAVHAPQTKRGEKNKEPTPDQYNTLESYELRINRSAEKWNVYRILKTGQTMRVRLTVSRIRRIKDKFDKDGLPFYLIDSGPMIIMDPLKKNMGQ